MGMQDDKVLMQCKKVVSSRLLRWQPGATQPHEESGSTHREDSGAMWWFESGVPEHVVERGVRGCSAQTNKGGL